MENFMIRKMTLIISRYRISSNKRRASNKRFPIISATSLGIPLIGVTIE